METSTIPEADELYIVFNHDRHCISMILQALPQVAEEEFHCLSRLDRLHQAQ